MLRGGLRGGTHSATTRSSSQETRRQEQGGMVSLSCHPGRPATHAGSVSWMAWRSLRRMAAAVVVVMCVCGGGGDMRTELKLLQRCTAATHSRRHPYMQCSPSSTEASPPQARRSTRRMDRQRAAPGSCHRCRCRHGAAPPPAAQRCAASCSGKPCRHICGVPQQASCC